MSDNLGLGQRIVNKKYGKGTIISKIRSRRGSWNYGVRFDNGGPQGWAEKATHDVKDLKALNQ
jgi:hypothetical protein